MKTLIYLLSISFLFFLYSCQSDDLFNDESSFNQETSEEIANPKDNDYEEIILDRANAASYLKALGVDDDVLNLLLQDQIVSTRYATGQYGGQCLVFVQNYFKHKPTVPYAKQLYNSKYVTKLGNKIASKTIACWAAGTYGHVGVVHSYDPKTKKMTYIDSNYKLNERITVRKNLPVSSMKSLVKNFQGFAKFK